MNKKLLFIFLFLTIAAGVVFTANATVCHQYTSSSVPPAGYGAVYDVFDAAKRLLLQVDCGTSGATFNVGYGNPSQIIYEEGWKYTGTTWQKIIFSGVAKFESGGVTYPWYVGSATANIPSSLVQSGDNYVVAYVCTDQAGAWKCGCRDSACASNRWQLQVFQVGGGTDGGGGSFPTNPRGDCNAPGAFDRSHCYSTPVCFLVDDSLDDELRGSGSQCYLTGGDGLGGTTCTALGKKKCCTSGGATYCEACYRNPGGRGRSPVRCERISGI